MSDLWTYSLSPSPPNIHNSSLPDSSASSHPLSSSSTFKSHGNHAHTTVTSNHLPEHQEASLQLPHSQATFPHPHLPQSSSPHLSHSKLTSFHLHPPQVITSHIVPQPHATPPQLHPTQITSPHWHYSQVTSPHLPPPEVTPAHPHYSQGTSPQLSDCSVNSPHLASPQFTNPQLFPSAPSKCSSLPQYQRGLSYNPTHPQGTFPHHPHTNITSPTFEPQPQVTSFNLVPQCQITSPHILSPPPNPLPSQNHDPGLGNLTWSRSESSPELSCFPNSYSYSYQFQTTAHLDFNLQNQNRFSAGVTRQRDMELENTNSLPSNTHAVTDNGLYAHVDACDPVQDPWEPLDPTLSELQCSPLSTISGGETTGRWNPVEFISSSTEDFFNTQFFPDSYHDNNGPQPFCSPPTPGPNLHYPPTPIVSSPGPQIHSRKERLVPTPSHLKATVMLSCSLHESNSYPVTSDPSWHQPHGTSSCLTPIKTESIQDKSCFSTRGRGQDGNSAVQSPDLSAGLNWKVECGERGKRVRGGNGQPESAWIKPSQHEKSSAPAYRLQCTVCKRDFKSLPALNGHMRSHSGIRAATCLKKGEDSSLPVQPSGVMVMPVSVPVQSRGASKACRSTWRRCSQLTLTSEGTMLFHSLMHSKDEDTRGNKDSGENGEEVFNAERVTSGGRNHYTPRPMLCPQRVGPGLYCSLTRKQQAIKLLNMHNRPKEHTATETLMTGINKPQINVGCTFQAQIPALQDQKNVHFDSHNALLLWTPWDKLECPTNEERVEEFLTMARSSVMPGGGVSPEYALHVLSESRGDFLLTVEKLLSTPDVSNNHKGWSATERRLLVKSFQQHHKDFNSIQRDVKTKSLSQCVEYYYLWKKKLSLTVKIPAQLTITLPDTNCQRSSRPNNAA